MAIILISNGAFSFVTEYTDLRTLPFESQLLSSLGEIVVGYNGQRAEILTVTSQTSGP
jgi:hypothetical protein